MPLPSDPALVKTSSDIVEGFHAVFGKHAGYRATHAKGLLLTGTFTPSTLASTLSTAPHFTSASTPLTIRFSNSTGIPVIPDTDPNASPRGIAIRFNLPKADDGMRRHTDIIAHSTPFFPVRTGEEFLEFLHALKAGGEKVGEFLGSHPAAVKFVEAPKPLPTGFGREKYWGVNAYVLVDGEGKRTAVRYQVVPTEGVELLGDEALKEKGPYYLAEELITRLQGSDDKPVVFKLIAQVAKEGDVIDDATVRWPEDRDVVELGVVEVEKVVDEKEQASEQKRIIFDPVPRVEGVEESGDPLVQMRAGVYLISGKERREA